MKTKLFILSIALFVCITTIMADPVEVILSDVANYIDFHALSISDSLMTNHQVTSTAPYTLKNGTILRGYMDPDTHEELINKWVVKNDYNTSLPTPSWVGVDSLIVGTSFRATRETTITLGSFRTTDVGKMTIYFQPNGDAQRGVSVSIRGKEVAQLTGSGAKINGVRPAYAGEIDLPAGLYEAGDVIIKLISNTSNIFGVDIEKLCNRVDGIYYIYNFENLTAEVTYGDTAYYGKISIPDTVISNGQIFAVTSIGDSAFYNSTYLTDVNIPNSVTNIGNSAFLECTSLASVAIDAETPPILGDNVFSYTNNFYIYVPCGTLGAYKTSWSLYASQITYKPLELKYAILGEVNIEGAGKVQLPTICNNNITAIPNYGYHFIKWKDGNTDNPRIIELTQDTTLVAEFAIDKSGTCGKDSALTWFFDDQSMTLTITGDGELTENCTYGVEAPTQMKTLIIGNDVTSIGDSAFYGMATINHLIIGGNVASIGNYAFAECKNFDDITCHAQTVPTISATTFANVGNKQYIYLYVPKDRERAYKRDINWGEFDIQVQKAETTITDGNVQITTSDNTVEITWPSVNNAETYEIVVTKDGEVVCTLIFNANGQLAEIAFTHGRNDANHARQAQTAGFKFTVTGLNSGTQYEYSIESKDTGGQTIDSKSGSFTTTVDGEPVNPTEDMDVLSIEGKVGKILRDGQILILRGDKTYTVTGNEL